MIGFLTKTSETFSREWLVFWAIGSAFLLMIVKTFIYQKIKAIRIRGNNEKRVIYIGNKDAMEKMQLRLKQSPWFGYRGVAWVSVDAPESIAKMTDLDYAGNLSVFNPQTPEDIIFKDILAIYQADELWIVDHLDMCTKISDLLQNETIDIRFILDLDFADLSKYPVTDFMGVLAWNVSISPFQEDKRLIKWLEDKILAALILVLISPLLLVIAIGIKLTSPGAVLFKQKRHGWDGKIITVYKFRSMKTHQEKDGGVTQAQKNDPRITAFGAFLRRTSLDELPQFYNVLQGSMSIVGPRPHALAHNDHYSELIDEYMRRHKVKPGITGWAQINGWRGETDTLEKMQGRVDADLYYIRNWSFWLDIKIILLTVLRAFTDKNAY
jgi:putative colanic acid biosynthesis UDP-glucose lipid carrier transferase